MNTRMHQVHSSPLSSRKERPQGKRPCRLVLLFVVLIAILGWSEMALQNLFPSVAHAASTHVRQSILGTAQNVSPNLVSLVSVDHPHLPKGQNVTFDVAICNSSNAGPVTQEPMTIAIQIPTFMSLVSINTRINWASTMTPGVSTSTVTITYHGAVAPLPGACISAVRLVETPMKTGVFNQTFLANVPGNATPEGNATSVTLSVA